MVVVGAVTALPFDILLLCHKIEAFKFLGFYLGSAGGAGSPRSADIQRYGIRRPNPTADAFISLLQRVRPFGVFSARQLLFFIFNALRSVSVRYGCRLSGRNAAVPVLETGQKHETTNNPPGGTGNPERFRTPVGNVQAERNIPSHADRNIREHPAVGRQTHRRNPGTQRRHACRCHPLHFGLRHRHHRPALRRRKRRNRATNTANTKRS